jgi:hypothetical protein
VKLLNRESLPHTSLANTEIILPEAEFHDVTFTDDQNHEPLALFTRGSVYGIQAISHCYNAYDDPPTTIQFWSASPTADIDHPLSFQTSSHLIKFDSPVASGAAVGSPCLWVGPSGNYVLALFRGEDEAELCLICHDHQTKSLSSRVLTLPNFLAYQLDDVCSIGLDDHLGKVLLAMGGGALCEVSYI